MAQLPEDCLHEIFQYLDDNHLCSCLLVCRIWCQISIRILWRNVWNIETLITCLPEESKVNLHRNEIPVSDRTPLINYASFCKIFMMNKFHERIMLFLNPRHSATSTVNLDIKISVLSNELLNLLVSNASLKSLHLLFTNPSITSMIDFASLFGVNNFLQDMTELYCNSNHSPGFYSGLSRLCRNVQSLDLSIENSISNANELANFLFRQRNMKSLDIWQHVRLLNDNLILGSIPNSVTELGLNLPSVSNLRLIIGNLNNLRILKLSITDTNNYNGIESLEFLRLKILKFPSKFTRPTNEYIINFLNIHGGKLKEIHIARIEESLRNNIIHLCPNITVTNIISIDD
ncbi:hypothetical protein RclHR1_00340033 [Rhizophagus clarus]|uniref:F-box domain-containing protein n=1 Tax=Rhizophagus clarus TaxID=94130 RepID=A0A2Z6RDL1_9GLOM|nr:hypothetical protein RclHR1_00340033 [Rhizophagus clarus]GES92843.1 hypothetical protein GLOIN_2v1876115 [Rhizophagus clarus]